MAGALGRPTMLLLNHDAEQLPGYLPYWNSCTEARQSPSRSPCPLGAAERCVMFSTGTCPGWAVPLVSLQGKDVTL